LAARRAATGGPTRLRVGFRHFQPAVVRGDQDFKNHSGFMVLSQNSVQGKKRETFSPWWFSSETVFAGEG
jgi:hypothetical protein